MEFVGFMLVTTVFAVVIGVLAQDAINMWYCAEEMEEEAVAEYSTASHFHLYDLSDGWCEKQAQ
ncbi:MAG: hypothetical protein J6A75_13275 [Lachnospiraceae bacterium]|nr:hypothetical protein [Lachnospiraceae bacterium]